MTIDEGLGAGKWTYAVVGSSYLQSMLCEEVL